MTKTLLEQLIEFYQEDPQDPFNIYGLAMEYLKTDVGKSIHFFDELLGNHPNYLPTYYQAAELHVSLNNFDKALEIYLVGIKLAKLFGQNKVEMELLSAYRNLLEELED